MTLSFQQHPAYVITLSLIDALAIVATLFTFQLL